MAGSLTKRQIRLLTLLARAAGGNTSKCCVETGTYRGDSALVLATQFDVVHTVELSEKWFAYSRDRLKTQTNIRCHQGDSASVMERLVAVIEEPAFFSSMHILQEAIQRSVPKKYH